MHMVFFFLRQTINGLAFFFSLSYVRRQTMVQLFFLIVRTWGRYLSFRQHLYISPVEGMYYFLITDAI